MNTVQLAWEYYRRTSVPLTAGIIEERGAKRSFYAGVASILGIMQRLEEQRVSDEAGAAVLEGLERECIEFARVCDRGAA